MNNLEHPDITRVRRYGLTAANQPVPRCEKCKGAVPSENERLCGACRGKVRSRFADLMEAFSDAEQEYIDVSLDGVSPLDWMKGAMG